jgi:hypothetical protein
MNPESLWVILPCWLLVITVELLVTYIITKIANEAR